MVIGIDIRDLRVARTGQKTVTEELCKQFAALQDPEMKFVFLDSSYPVYTGKKKWRIMLEHIRYQYWKQIVLPVKAWRANCDIVFCGDYFAPYIRLGYKTVEIFYDAFFFENPEHCNKLWLKLFHHIAIPAARRCNRIMTITDYSKKRLHELAGFPIEQLVTIYPAPKTFQIPNTGSLETNPFVAKGKKYILHVGVMEKRKNLPVLIKAFHLLSKKGYEDFDLVLVGQGNGKVHSDDSALILQTIEECGLQNRVILTGYLADSEIPPLYKNAFMYVFPSLNEGFGLPILEAFRFHLPVIASNNTCLPEVGGEGILSFNPYQIEDLCDKIELVINNETLRNELIKKGNERLKFFSWEKASADLIKVFKEILNK